MDREEIAELRFRLYYFYRPAEVDDLTGPLPIV